MTNETLHLSPTSPQRKRLIKNTTQECWPGEDSKELTLYKWNTGTTSPQPTPPTPPLGGSSMKKELIITSDDIPPPSTSETEDDSNKSSSIQEQDQRPRKVAFAQFGRAKKTLTLKSYTPEEKFRCWYTREEYYEMRQRSIANATRMESGKPPKKGDSYRGLENKTKYGKSVMIRNLCRGKAAVLQEQAAQRKANTSSLDADAIASLYAGATACSGMVAATAGLEDERAAKLIYEEEEDDAADNECPNKRRKKRVSIRIKSKKVRQTSQEKNRNNTTTSVEAEEESDSYIDTEQEGEEQHPSSTSYRNEGC